MLKFIETGSVSELSTHLKTFPESRRQLNDRIDDMGNTILHKASERFDLDMIMFLLTEGTTESHLNIK